MKAFFVMLDELEELRELGAWIWASELGWEPGSVAQSLDLGPRIGWELGSGPRTWLGSWILEAEDIAPHIKFMWCTVYIVEVCVGAVLPLGEG